MNQKKGFLKTIEVIGNKLPNPAILFIILLGALAVLSAVLAYFNVTALHPVTHKTILIKNLISREGLHWILTEMVKNYVNFPPLGMIIVLTMGIGLIDKVGLMQTFIKASIHSIPHKYITFTIVFLSFMSHVASDAAIVIMPPIAAAVFYSLGRHPFAGFAASLSAIMSGFTANILIVTTDVLLSGITTQAAKIVDPNAIVTPVDNWYFMCAAVFVLSIVTTLVNDKIVEPRLGKYQGSKEVTLEKPSQQQLTALRSSGIAALVYLIILLAMVVPEGALLRNPETGTILNSPLMKGIVPLLLFFFITIGLTFGIKTGSVRTGDDVVKMMSSAIKDLAGFMVMVFGIAQFIAAFTWTNIATMIATSGAEFLVSIHMTGLPALLCFMLTAQILGLFMASGSALWALLSPVFVPMFMMLGYHPAFIQLAFRAGDGALNSVMPINPFLPLFVDALQQYKSEAGIGTYFALMMPYAIAFLIGFYSLFSIWYALELPPGPGVAQRLW